MKNVGIVPKLYSFIKSYLDIPVFEISRVRSRIVS